MKLSARNVLKGQVVEVTLGAVNAQVSLDLKGGQRLYSTITHGSVEALGLQVGRELLAIIKASSVIVGKGVDPAKLSTRNVLTGRVCKVVDGPVSAEVDLEIAPGLLISAIITHESARTLGFAVGDQACALIKASGVILGIEPPKAAKAGRRSA